MWRQEKQEPTLIVGTHPDTNHTSEIEKAFLENHEMVYRAAYRITGNASDAEDVLQTLFLRLIRKEWVPEPRFGWPAYLHRAAINISLDIVRARSRHVDLGEGELPIEESRPDAHREQAANEVRTWLTKALSTLNPTAAEMFVLRYVEGYAVQEIAQMLDTSRGTVAVTLFRTRSRLRKSIRQFLGGR